MYLKERLEGLKLSTASRENNGKWLGHCKGCRCISSAPSEHCGGCVCLQESGKKKMYFYLYISLNNEDRLRIQIGICIVTVMLYTLYSSM